jgi:anti-sigma factor RsiW
MTECIDPAAIKEGDLMAYLEGEATERVQAHIERCPACAAEVVRLRNTYQGLLRELYRTDCPAPEVLGQHKMKLLSPAQQLEIAAHVRDCPHCTRELEELTRAEEREDRLVQVVLQVLQDVAQTVEATMVSRGRRQPVGVRGAETDSAPLHFHSDEVDVLIGFQPTTLPTETRTLLGAVVQAEVVSGCRAWLFQEGEAPVSSPVDRLGTFTFVALSPGEYDLALEVGRKALLMRNVIVA